jgi:hypothetical protein
MSASADSAVSPERVREILREQDEKAKAAAKARALLEEMEPEPEPEPSPEESEAHEREERVKRLTDLAAERGLALHEEAYGDLTLRQGAGLPTHKGTFALAAIVGHHQGRANSPMLEELGSGLSLDQVEEYLTTVEPPTLMEQLKAREVLHAKPGLQEDADKAAQAAYRSITRPR